MARVETPVRLVNESPHEWTRWSAPSKISVLIEDHVRILCARLGLGMCVCLAAVCRKQPNPASYQLHDMPTRRVMLSHYSHMGSRCLLFPLPWLTDLETRRGQRPFSTQPLSPRKSVNLASCSGHFETRIPNRAAAAWDKATRGLVQSRWPDRHRPHVRVTSRWSRLVI